jgi:hypothetical protein
MSEQLGKLILIIDSVVVEFDQSLISIQEIKDRLEKSAYKFVRIATRV